MLHLGFGRLGRSWEPGLGGRRGDLGRFEGGCPETGSPEVAAGRGWMFKTDSVAVDS